MFQLSFLQGNDMIEWLLTNWGSLSPEGCINQIYKIFLMVEHKYGLQRPPIGWLFSVLLGYYSLLKQFDVQTAQINKERGYD